MAAHQGYEELCDKIKTIIVQKKPQILRYMDKTGKETFNREWDSKRNRFINKLFEEEEFINMCFPTKYKKNKSLNQLLSKHIEFCKEKDKRLSAIGESREYSVCLEYNKWIIAKTASFTSEYLQNVKNYKINTVKKYFSTKEHPEGYDPLTTYRNSKFDCEKYNPTSKSYQPIQVTKAPTDRSNLPTAPTDRQESQGKSGIPVPDEGEIEKTKSHVKELSKIEPPPDSLTSSINKTKEDGSAIGKEPRTSPENEPTKTKNTDHSNSGHNDDEQIRNDVLLTGKPVSETPPVSESSPVPELISVSKNSPDYNDPKYHQFLHHLRSNLDGYKIPFHDYHIIHKIPVKLFQSYKTYEEHIPSEPTITKPYIWYPAPLPRSRSYPDPFPRQTMYPVASFFPTKLSPFPIITSASRNKEMEIVRIQLPTPDPSLFRSPVMIYTLVFLYTTFGLFFGKNKKKKRLKRQLQITKLDKEVSHFNTMDNYSTNDTPYENKKGNEKNIYNQIKMQKGIIHKNIILPKRKKKNHKAIIDIHMELLNECKNDEWELNKDDFLQICLEQFTKEQNKIYSNSKNSNLITKSLSTENAKEAKMLLWDKWTEKYTPIWENFKRGNTFKILQYYWKEEENSHLYKIKNENSSLNQNENFSYIQIKKDIWKRWTTKQAKLIEQYKEEQWFKSLVEELENVSDEYKNGKIKDDIFVANIKELENKDNNEDLYKHVKHIFLIKVFIQILMMVIEECIKEESSEKTEIVLDNLIEKLNKEKHENIELENIHQENMNHKEYNEMLEQKRPKNQENFKELIEGQKAKMIYK
ncbi:STP1 protein [Plasmodium ovale wallikeri]|uniref:STP1 protein n=1 Tax=Plasmodium ovale wallikeri TaxID=864142 RepID=A0A1A9AJA5_PLAOA|nr:STP1 protein [Plasmodium ovale wallikeri]